jgi:hypothetical protein
MLLRQLLCKEIRTKSINRLIADIRSQTDRQTDRQTEGRGPHIRIFFRTKHLQLSTGDYHPVSLSLSLGLSSTFEIVHRLSKELGLILVQLEATTTTTTTTTTTIQHFLISTSNMADTTTTFVEVLQSYIWQQTFDKYGQIWSNMVIDCK